MAPRRTKSTKSLLEEALDKAESSKPGGLPRALPAGHIATAKDLTLVLSDRKLTNRYCDVMRRRILYLFYGGLFYRTGVRPTQEESNYPIGFLFHPTIVDASDIHYPFDTGAFQIGIYEDVPKLLKSFKKTLMVRFSTLKHARRPSDVPRLLVKHLFSTNQHYLAGTPDTHSVQKPHPIPDLLRFFLGPNDASDHRRAGIEIQHPSSLPLNEKLLWLGYPDTYEDQVQDFLRKIDPHVPDRWAYPSYTRYRPSDICARLDQKANDALRNFFAD